MFIILSPAKNMKIEETRLQAQAMPPLYEKALPLAAYLKKLSPPELASLMKINDGLSLEVWGMYQDFDLKAWQEVKAPALLTYDGLVFKYLNQEPWTASSFAYATKHLAILSGLLGVVRADDKILPYRLEMQTKVQFQGKNLYEYWGDDIYQNILKLIDSKELIVNLASKEYSRCIKSFLPDSNRMIEIEFKVYRQGRYKVLGTFAKMARGLMARYIIENRIQKVEDLYEFDGLGYRYRSDLSSLSKLVFVKKDE